MKKNMHPADRWIRILLAAAAVILYVSHILIGTVGIILMVVAAIFLLTSIIGICPLYSLFGIGTAKNRKI
jgi:hypothetical protein